MPTYSFWARTTSSTGNASTLIVGNGSATQITFTTDSIANPAVDDNGDLVLESTNGQPDPDTWVIINGVKYSFTYDIGGNFPNTGQAGDGKVPLALRGDAVGVIRTPVGNFFFVLDGSGTQALMNQTGNGNLVLLNENQNPPPIYVCFCAGTMIATPSGPRAVETLAAGDAVLNDAGAATPVLWVGKSCVSLDELRANPELAPIRIPAHAFGAALPDADLYISPQHRVVIGQPTAELLFGQPRVLAAARHLVGSFAETVSPAAAVEYFHILTERHEIVVSNGLPTESFQPARRTIDVMTPATRAALEAVIKAHGRGDMLTRPDALLDLKRSEVVALLSAMRHPMAADQPVAHGAPQAA